MTQRRRFRLEVGGLALGSGWGEPRCHSLATERSAWDGGGLTEARRAPQASAGSLGFLFGGGNVVCSCRWMTVKT
jgi:hypothetical protein